MRALTNFEEVYAVYFDDVYRYLLSLSGSESVAEELTSEQRQNSFVQMITIALDTAVNMANL